MKCQPELVEGPEAWKRFEGVMKNVLAVPHSEIQQRIKEQRRKAASSPKRKTKPTASPDA
jgi:primosomal protein N'